MVYHNQGSKTEAATYVYKTTGRPVFNNFGVGHRTRVRGTAVDSVGSRPILGFGSAQEFGTEYRIGISVSRDGVKMTMNGREVVLSVPASDLRPASSHVQICPGIVTGESEDYSIDFNSSIFFFR